MKSVVYWSLVSSFLSAGSAFGAVPISSVRRVSNLPTVPNKFIVEVDVLANIPNKRSFTRSLDAVYASLKARDVGFEVGKEFEADGLFVGATVTVNSTADVIALQNTPGIKAIRPITRFERPKPVFQQVVKSVNDPAVPVDSLSTHVLTGVDKLHAKGIFGKGIKIGIIDTGIDYNHPSLGKGFGPGKKVIGGYDFVGDAYTGTNAPVPDSDPLDECAGHGTHVAGIIAADPGNEFNISGVAYESSLSAYRVFGCNGTTDDEVIVDALLRGVKDEQDILTLSLGGADGWTESSSSIVASRIAKSGIIVTIAAGNEGSDGSWYTSSPGNGVDVISVASLENTVVPLQKLNLLGVEHEPIIYFSFLPLPVQGELPLYAISNDTTIPNDACEPLPDTTPDLSGFVVLVRRGSCIITQKLDNIAAKGGKVMLIYDNGNGFAGVVVGNFTAALIQAADGQFLVEQVVAGVPVKVSFPQTGGPVDFPSPSGGLISSFSTYGPTNDFYFKPAVAAPGGNILSTLPVALGGFAVESGTSMATPFVAGSAALVLSIKGKGASVAKSTRDLFETTAQAVPSSHTDGALLQTLTQQGAGLINVYEAIFSTSTVTPGQLILNDTTHFKGVHEFTIKNNAKENKSYTLTHVAAGTALTVQPDSIFAALGPVPLSPAAASVSITPPKFSLNAGETKTVTVRFTPPSGLDAKQYPVYSGFIQVAAPGENYHVSYLGLAASLKEKTIIDNTDVFFGEKIPAILDSAGAVQKNPVNYTFVGVDIPTLLFRLAFGSPVVRADLVEPTITLNTTLQTRDHSRHARGSSGHHPHLYTFPNHNNGGSFSKVKILGPLAEFNYISRNNEVPTENAFRTFAVETPTFANGTTIPNGAYRVLLRALKVTGDRSKQEDYESWLSPIIGVAASA